jgi:hypothetical protein
MPIIINEFEIVPAPAPKTEAAPAQPAPAQPLRPDDVERIETRHQRRSQRLWAD